MTEMIPEFSELVAFERMANDEQYKWVITGWMNSYKYYWDEFYNPGWEGFYKIYRPVIVKRLEEIPPLIAVLKDDPDLFMSFCCGKKGHLYYSYTKGIYRRNGLASALLDEECGKEPGVYHSKTFKKYYIRSLNRKGWRYEGEKEKIATNDEREETTDGQSETSD